MYTQYTLDNDTHTTGNFFEVDKLGMRPHLFASRDVGVDVTLLQPRVVVSSETVWGDFTSLFTVLDFLKLSKDLSTTLDIESFVNRNGLSWKQNTAVTEPQSTR